MTNKTILVLAIAVVFVAGIFVSGAGAFADRDDNEKDDKQDKKESRKNILQSLLGEILLAIQNLTETVENQELTGNVFVTNDASNAIPVTVNNFPTQSNQVTVTNDQTNPIPVTGKYQLLHVLLETFSIG